VGCPSRAGGTCHATVLRPPRVASAGDDETPTDARGASPGRVFPALSAAAAVPSLTTKR
jgi:hypothetical protein